MSRRLVQRNEPDVVASYPLAEIGDVRQRDHGMPVGLARQPVDQVDHAVFKSAHVKAIDDVRNQRALINGGGNGHWRIH